MKAETAQSVDDYISTFPPEVQTRLHKLREIVKAEAPEAVETIKYRIPTFVLQGNLLHFAGYANHIGFYPTPSVLQAFAKEIRSYKNAKGSVQFPLDEAMPYGLIKRMVRFRVRDVMEKAKVKRTKTTRK